MLVREVMSSPVVMVRNTDPVRRAIRTLHAHDITAAPVLDARGHLIGIVSELDLLRGEFQPDPRAYHLPPPQSEPPPRTVAEVMSGHVLTVTETTDVTAAIDLMVSKKIKSLPVVRGETVVGILSRRDLLAMLSRPDEELREAVAASLAEQYGFGPHWEVAVHDGVAVLTGLANPYADSIADVIARTVPGVIRVEHRRIP